MKMRIGTRLMLGAAVGALTVVLIVSLAAYRIARRGLEKEIQSHLRSVAQSRAAHVWTFLDEHKEYIWLAARSTRLVEGLRSLKAGHPDPASVVRTLNARLSLLPDPDADVYEVLLLDRDGLVVASMHPGSIGLDRSADAAFVGGRDGPFITDPYLCARTSRQSFSISAPVLDEEGGPLLGVLVARFDMAGLNAICTDQTGLGRTGETYLINKYSFMITPSRSEKDTFLKLKLETANARRALADVEAMRRGLLPEAHEHETMIVADYRGVRALGVPAHIPEMDWCLLAEIGAAEAFAPVAQLKKTLVIFGALFSAAALVGAYFFARRVSRPIHRLHRGSERIGAGELDYRLEVKTGDEIEQLADAFNRMAGKLSESYTSLEQKVAERTADLTAEVTERERVQNEVRRYAGELKLRNEELARERERALEASRLKSQFLANMSHELRTPINAVLGYARFLQRQGDNLTAQQKSDVERIRVRTNDLLNLINDVLDLSKIEAGRMDLSLAPAAAPSLIQDALTAVRPMADHKGLALKCLPLPPDLSPIQTDARKVVQILINLLSNAVKFTEKGSVTIGVRLAHQPGELPEAPALLRDQMDRFRSPMVVFSVTDTGIGIPPEHLLHVFEEFRQLDGGPSRKQGGTGLGLSISQKLAGVLGGDLWAESRPGVGSTFHLAITTDLAQARADNVMLQAEVTRAERETEPPGEQPVILAIEDDADTVIFLQRHLSERGFRVLSAFDGKEGLRQARGLQPDGIILDILIPEQDGWSVLSELKSDPKIWDIPVVVYSVVESAQRGLSLGAEDYLVKPVEGERLAQVIERVVNGHRGAVLIVDDDPDALDTYGRLLRERSLNVVTAAGGRQCLKEIETQTPALILLDLMMPDLDGFEVLRQLEERPEWGRVPVVVLTAKDLTKEERHALRGRVQDIVQKTGLNEEFFANQIVSLLHRTSRKKEGSRNEKA